MTDPRRLVVCTSDTHAGATTAACRKPVQMDDGPTVHPGRLNLLMAEKIERGVQFAYKESVRLGSAGADVQSAIPTVLLHNGDLTEGKHHSTHQVLIPEQTGYQVEVALDLLSIYTEALSPVAILFTQGTEAHVGKGGELEKAVAGILEEKGFPVKRSPDTDQLVPQYWDFTAGGHQIWAAHHGKVGRLPHTKGSQAALHASHVFLQEALDNFRRVQEGEQPHPVPRVIIGSHHHQKADSGPHFPIRAIQLPCWTFRNSFAHKVAAFSREDIGLATIYCDPDRPDPEVSWWCWSPRRATGVVV